MSKNIEMNIKSSDGTYEVLYPATNNENISMDSNLMSQYGISASNFNDFVGWIGKYNLYWWKRGSVSYGSAIGEYKDVTVYIASQGVFNNFNVSASSNISVTKNKVVLLNPFTISFTYGSGGYNLSDLKGYYFHTRNMTENAIIYKAPDGNEWNGRIDDRRVYATGAEVSPVKNVGNWEFLYSLNREAYPDSNEVDGYEYQYLGTPLENLKDSKKNNS